MGNESSDRKQRLKAALRDNLRRRKAGGSPGATPTETAGSGSVPDEGETRPSKPDAQ